MTRQVRRKLLALFAFAICSVGFMKAEFTADVELSYVIPGYIDVRIPGDTGDFFSASDIGEDNDLVTARIRAGWQSLDGDHEIFLLVAPFFSEYTGVYNQDLFFFEENFQAGEELTLSYKFNSYRAGYRYTFYRDENWKLAAGAAVKVRDAFIEVSSDSRSSRKDDLGFVPLLTVLAQYKINDDFSLILDGDGLASPMGRAFDVLTGLRWSLNDNIGIRANYRFLDGGADNDEVYNFAFFSYLSLGFDYNFYDMP